MGPRRAVGGKPDQLRADEGLSAQAGNGRLNLSSLLIQPDRAPRGRGVVCSSGPVASVPPRPPRAREAHGKLEINFQLFWRLLPRAHLVATLLARLSHAGDAAGGGEVLFRRDFASA
jgi:hypothetical protein